MIFLNLFLAILLDNFEVEEEEEEDPNHVSLIMKLNSFKSSIYERISDKFNDILWKLHLWRLKRKKEESSFSSSGHSKNASYERENGKHDGEDVNDLNKGFKIRLFNSGIPQSHRSDAAL